MSAVAVTDRRRHYSHNQMSSFNSYSLESVANPAAKQPAAEQLAAEQQPTTEQQPAAEQQPTTEQTAAEPEETGPMVRITTGGKLASQDYDVPRSKVMCLRLVATMVDVDDDELPTIPLPNVSWPTWVRVRAFLDLHAKEPMRPVTKPLQDDDLTKLMQSEYVKYVDYDIYNDTAQEEFTELVLAANYLDCIELLDLCCIKIASCIKNKTPEQIRNYLRLPEVPVKPEDQELLQKAQNWVNNNKNP